MTDTKHCPDCGQHRPVGAFYKIASRYDGLSSYCIEHQLQRDRDHKKKRRDAYRARNTSYMREYRAKQAATQVALPTLEAKPVKKSCTCHQYQTCLVCRNAERRDAFKTNRIPVYRLAAMTAAMTATGD
jgi:hypothetical protein